MYILKISRLQKISPKRLRARARDEMARKAVKWIIGMESECECVRRFQSNLGFRVSYQRSDIARSKKRKWSKHFFFCFHRRLNVYWQFCRMKLQICLLNEKKKWRLASSSVMRRSTPRFLRINKDFSMLLLEILWRDGKLIRVGLFPLPSRAIAWVELGHLI